jgi:hypothetical protein
MRRLLAAACACAVAFSAGVSAQASMAEEVPPPAPTTAPEPEVDIGDYLLAEISKVRRETWHWERLMRIRLTSARRVAERSNDREHRLLILKGWKQLAAKRRRQAQRPPFKSAWLCIYRHERHPRMGWRSRTGNGFFGGLQMDLAFQRAYAPELLMSKGTADRWKPIEQIWVAVRAHRSGLGFTPWPNTARTCGLL